MKIPLRYSQTFGCVFDSDEEFVADFLGDYKMAAQIVRAVNCHDELLSLLKRVLEVFSVQLDHPNETAQEDTLDAIRKAIANSEKA